MRRDVQFTWHPGGDRSQAARSFSTSAESAHYLRDVAGRIERMPPGDSRSALLRELVFLMDLFSTFDGRFVDGQDDPDDEVPAYLSTVELEAASNALSATERLFDAPPDPSARAAA